MRLYLSFFYKILYSLAEISGVPDDKELLHRRMRVVSKAIKNMTKMEQSQELL